MQQRMQGMQGMQGIQGTGPKTAAMKHRRELTEQLNLLLLAAQTGDLAFVRAFAGRADYDEIRVISATPTVEVPLTALHAAIIGQQHAVVAFLLAHGEEMLQVTNTTIDSTFTITDCCHDTLHLDPNHHHVSVGS
jgi:hypothetical protein